MSTIYADMTRTRTQGTVGQGQKPKGMPMVKNSGGCYTFELDKFKQLQRFLFLGSEGGSYYASAQKLTKENAQNVLAAIREDGERVVREVVAISDSGRAPNNDPALFVLTLASKFGDLNTRRAAYKALDKVARTFTHLSHALTFRESCGGWGRGWKRAVQNWYLNKPLDRLALQAIKYRQRDGWSQRDALRLAKPKPDSPERASLFGWIANGKTDEHTHRLVEGFMRAQEAPTAEEVVKLIEEYRLPREAIPTKFLNERVVWESLLQKMPATATLRNLGKMSSLGMFDSPGNVDLVTSRLTNEVVIRQARMHPVNILLGHRTYKSGHGLKGNLTWKVNNKIADAVESAFYTSFHSVVPTGSRVMIAVDVSGSMGFNVIPNSPLSARNVAAAMAMTFVRTEPQVMTFGFCHKFTPLNINKTMKLDAVEQEMNKRNFGSTDCSLPFEYARKNNLEVDVFMVYTDNETNHHRSKHAYQAVRDYRAKMGIPAKLVVAGMTANRFSIADPNDAGMLDVVGFDSAMPRVVSEFVRGWGTELPLTN